MTEAPEHLLARAKARSEAAYRGRDAEAAEPSSGLRPSGLSGMEFTPAGGGLVRVSRGSHWVRLTTDNGPVVGMDLTDDEARLLAILLLRGTPAPVDSFRSGLRDVASRTP